MTILLKKPFLVIPINCHPVEAYPDFLPRCPGHDTPAYAAFIKESRNKFTNATNLNRKSGVAQWRDLLFPSVARLAGIAVKSNPVALGKANDNNCKRRQAQVSAFLL
jgi:hypothetical protein